jgi:hypothetical protein
MDLSIFEQWYHSTGKILLREYDCSLVDRLGEFVKWLVCADDWFQQKWISDNSNIG